MLNQQQQQQQQQQEQQQQQQQQQEQQQQQHQRVLNLNKYKLLRFKNVPLTNTIADGVSYLPPTQYKVSEFINGLLIQLICVGFLPITEELAYAWLIFF